MWLSKQRNKFRLIKGKTKTSMQHGAQWKTNNLICILICHWITQAAEGLKDILQSRYDNQETGRIYCSVTHFLMIIMRFNETGWQTKDCTGITHFLLVITRDVRRSFHRKKGNVTHILVIMEWDAMRLSCRIKMKCDSLSVCYDKKWWVCMTEKGSCTHILLVIVKCDL